MTVIDEMRSLFEGSFGTPPGRVDPDARRAVALTADPESDEDVTPALNEIRAQAEGLAASEEELLLLGLFGDDATPLLRAIRGRASKEEGDGLAGIDQQRSERIREVVRIVQESGIGELTIEEGGMRISVRQSVDVEPEDEGNGTPLARAEPGPAPAPALPSNGIVRIESPMVGTFYRASQPGAPAFVEEGDAVAAGQTLCILEAMKLMNEVKADSEGIIHKIHVGNAEPVEFGQLLFEVEPLTGRPFDAV
jgi:oxaloacetate decarboxylase alpha subunit